MRSSLPPSSAPQPSTNGRSPARRTADALNLGDEASEAGDDAQTTSSRRRRRAAGTRVDGDVPVVKDSVGESVTESFYNFLAT